TRAWTSASPIATSAARPRALSAMPGPSRRAPRRATDTSNSGPKTVSRCADRMTHASCRGAACCTPTEPPVMYHPRTFPTSSACTSCNPMATNISATRAPRAASAPVGAGIADSAAWRPSVASSERSMCARAVRTRSLRRTASITSPNYDFWGGFLQQLDLAWRARDTNRMEERELIYDWNGAGVNGSFDWTRARVDLNDETLRDGLQSPSVTDPSLDVKKRLLHLMADL